MDVVWPGRQRLGIYGQRYAADGTALGSEFRVNTYTTDAQMYPSVTALAGGGFVVTWIVDGQDGSGYGIYGQRYAADGTAVGSEFRVNTFTDGPAALSVRGGARRRRLRGDVDVGLGQDGSGYGIYGQRYAADGTAVGSEFRVNTFTTGNQVYPSVTALAGGGFVVTWSSMARTAAATASTASATRRTAPPVGSEFRVNQITAGNQSQHVYGSETVATLADGRLVQVWSGPGPRRCSSA